MGVIRVVGLPYLVYMIYLNFLLAYCHVAKMAGKIILFNTNLPIYNFYKYNENYC